MSVVITGFEPTTTRSHDVSGFSHIKLRGIGTLEIHQGDREGVEVDAPANLHDHIQVRVDADTLTVGLHDTTLHIHGSGTMELRFRVYVRSLTGIESSGAGKVIADRITADRLGIRCSGAAKIQLHTLEVPDLAVELNGAGKLLCDTLRSGTIHMALKGAGKVDVASLTTDGIRVSISGAGKITASGTANSQDISISGAGLIDFSGVRGQTARISLSGAGKALVNVSGSLDAHVSGTGKIAYAGNPHDVRQSTSGFGKVVSSSKS